MKNFTHVNPVLYSFQIVKKLQYDVFTNKQKMDVI